MTTRPGLKNADGRDAPTMEILSRGSESPPPGCRCEKLVVKNGEEITRRRRFPNRNDCPPGWVRIED